MVTDDFSFSFSVCRKHSWDELKNTLKEYCSYEVQH